MKPGIVVFCIIAVVFAIFSITYVILSILRELKRRREEVVEEKKEEKQYAADVTAHAMPAMLCGALFAASGLITWAILSKEKDPKKKKSDKKKPVKNEPKCKIKPSRKPLWGPKYTDFWWLIRR